MIKETIRIGLLKSRIRVGSRAGKFFNSNQSSAGFGKKYSQRVDKVYPLEPFQQNDTYDFVYEWQSSCTTNGEGEAEYQICYMNNRTGWQV